MKPFLRFICLTMVRFFYRRIHIVHRERMPTQGPVIMVANHPNGLLDPMIVNMVAGRRVAFLAKSTLFKPWMARQAMLAFDCIPVFRAKEADTKQNEQTFLLAKELLSRGGWLTLFPEGVSHSEPHLQRMKTGAARIALQAENPAITIVPVGLTYDAKDIFRSRVTATVGESIRIQNDDARSLTDRIEAGLQNVVLEADDNTLWNGFRFVARWLAGRDDEEGARRLGAAYRELMRRDPQEATALVEEARELASLLIAAGVEEPFEVEVEPRVRSLFATLSGVACVAPFALLGALLAYLPYRAIGPLAVRLARGESDIVSTIKALLGLVVIPLTYTAWTVAAGLWLGWKGALTMAVLGPFTGYVALRFDEWLSRRRRLLGAFWNRDAKKKISAARATLSEHIARALTPQ